MFARNRRAFAGLSALVVLLLVILTISRRSVPVVAPAPLVHGTAPEDPNSSYSNPDQFFAYHAAIRGAENSSVYPPSYRMKAFNKAVAARKQPGRKLAWVERGPANAPGRTRAVIVDPDDPSHRTWFAGSVSGGLWKTVDGGVSWESLTDHLPNLAVSALAMAPSDPDVIYIGTGEGFVIDHYSHVGGSGIFRSTDRGRTWTQLEATAKDPAFRFVNRIVVDPNDPQTVVAATNEGIFRTSDGGSAWKNVYRHRQGFRVQDLRAVPGNFDVQFATVHGSAILRSADAGRTWEVSLDKFVGGQGGRMELAIASSSPSIMYASAEGSTGFDGNYRTRGLYRTSDGGRTWNPVDIDGSTDLLGGQDGYNQTLAVHPYDTDRVLLGRVLLGEVSVATGIQERRYVGDFVNHQVWSSLIFLGFDGNFQGWLQTGDEVDEILDVTPSDLVSIEFRFGPGRSQKAHRYTVSQTSAEAAANKLDLPFSEYEYQDYVDVPFEVWDIDYNRQLMVSFRDDANDGEFNPAASPQWHTMHARGVLDTLPWEVVAVHGYAYGANEANERLSRDGGIVNRLLYYLVPIMATSEEWDPEILTDSYLRFTVDQAAFLSGASNRHAANCCVHVDHHNLILIPVDEARGEFKVLNANDGGVHFSEDGGETFTGSTGYNTTQFYGLDKKPGENVYIGGTQDNGSWLSGNNPQSDASWEHVLGGDGFDALWHATDARLVLASIYSNRIYRSEDGGRTFASIERPEHSSPFFTVLSNSRDVPDRVFAIGARGVWRSVDFGANWQVIPIPGRQWGFSFAGKVRVSLANADVVWAGYRMDDNGPVRGTMHVSLDGGERFRPTTIPVFAPGVIISGLATHPHQDSSAYVLFSAYGQPKILHTTDLGQSWQDLSGFADSQDGESTNGFPDVAVYDLLVMPHDPDIIWAGTEIGLFESTDGGTYWEYADNGLPAVSVWQMKLVDDQVILATHGRGIWTIDLPSAEASTGFGPVLGPDFVFFADGVNPRIKGYDGRIVMNPDDNGPDRDVLRFDYGPGAYRSFGFARNEGVNLTPNRARQDLLHARLRISPQNRGLEGLSLVLEDKTDGNRRVDGSADLPFRASWWIPEDLRDGMWHDVVVPLPPETWEALEEARLSGRLTGLAAHWHYDGAETPAGLRVARDGRGPDTAERPELWREFEWTNVHALGIVWDGGEGGGPVWVDYAYLGQPGLDLSQASQRAAAVPRVSVIQGEDGNVISWDGVPDAGGYHVYVSREPIADVSADGVSLLQRVSASEEAFSATHQVEVPHPSFTPLEAHYAVTSLGPYGAENADVSASTASVSLTNPSSAPVIVELTESESAQLKSAVEQGAVTRAGFPEWMTPLRLDSRRSSPGDGGSVVQDDNDLSGTFWMAQSPENELFVYAEVQDDIVKLAGESVPPGDSWQYDSFEIGLGNYDVRDITGGSMLTGTPHRSLERGIHADYLLRVSAHGDGSRNYIYAGGSLNSAIPGSAAAFDVLRNADGTGVGWSALAVIPLDAIQNAEVGDLVLDPVTDTELRLVPLNIALNDADQAGVRDSQIQWSTRPNADGNWWHSPVQWPVVAMVGRATWTGVAGAPAELPVTFSLNQNYPNPFNPQTTITFTLASDEPVTLAVFDALGRRVAVLLDRKELARGNHTVTFGAQGLASGVYFYELRAGNAFLESKRMMLVK